MKPSTREWVVKAEEDYDLVLAINRRSKKPLWGPLTFHAQQCVEKYLKARLEEAAFPIQKTHDLGQLLNHVLPVEPLWLAFQASLRGLSDFAVQPRYPGFFVTKREATQALKICKVFRKEARASLGLK